MLKVVPTFRRQDQRDGDTAASILIFNGTVLTMDDFNRAFDPGWVLIQGTDIAALGFGLPPHSIYEAATRKLDATRMIVVPGLVNGHDHLCQTLMAGTSDGLRLFEWLDSIVVPLQTALTPAELHSITQLGLVQSLHAGVTSVIDHLKLTRTQPQLDASAEAAATTGQRVMLALGWQNPSESRDTIHGLLDRFRQFFRDWHQRGPLTVAMGPLNTWACSPPTLVRTVQAARKAHVPVHIHVSESMEEVDLCRRTYGVTPIRWLANQGILGPDVHLVHSVWLDSGEVELIAKQDASVVHCPTSNLFLASGCAPVARMLRSGINVALGTDGAASGQTHDMLCVARTAGLLAKATTGDPGAIVASDLLRMLTRGGAQLFGQPNLGQLSVGSKADVSLFRATTTHPQGLSEPASALVYQEGGFDAHTVIVDGRVVLDAGRVISVAEEDILAKCEDVAYRLSEKLDGAGCRRTEHRERHA